MKTLTHEFTYSSGAVCSIVRMLHCFKTFVISFSFFELNTKQIILFVVD